MRSILFSLSLFLVSNMGFAQESVLFKSIHFPYEKKLNQSIYTELSKLAELHLKTPHAAFTPVELGQDNEGQKIVIPAGYYYAQVLISAQNELDDCKNNLQSSFQIQNNSNRAKLLHQFSQGMIPDDLAVADKLLKIRHSIIKNSCYTIAALTTMVRYEDVNPAQAEAFCKSAATELAAGIEEAIKLFRSFDSKASETEIKNRAQLVYDGPNDEYVDTLVTSCKELEAGSDSRIKLATLQPYVYNAAVKPGMENAK